MRNRTFSNKLKIRLSPIGFDGLNFSKRITSKYDIFRKSGKLPALIFLRLFASRGLNKITNIYLSNTVNNYFKHNFIVNLITFHKRLENISSPVPWLSNDKSYSNIQLQRKYLYRQAGTKRDENLIPPLWKRGVRGDFQGETDILSQILQIFKSITRERDASLLSFASHNILHLLRISSKETGSRIHMPYFHYLNNILPSSINESSNYFQLPLLDLALYSNKTTLKKRLSFPKNIHRQRFYKTTGSSQAALNYATTQATNHIQKIGNPNIEYTPSIFNQSIYAIQPFKVKPLDKKHHFFKLIQTKTRTMHSTLDDKHGIFLNRITDTYIQTERGFYKSPISNRTSAVNRLRSADNGPPAPGSSSVHRLRTADSGQRTPIYPEMTYFESVNLSQIKYLHDDSSQSALNYLSTQVSNHVQRIGNSNIQYKPSIFKRGVYSMQQSSPPFIKRGISNSLYFGKAGIKGGFSDKKHGIFLNRITDTYLQTKRGFYKFPISSRTSAVHCLLSADNRPPAPGRSSVHRLRTADSGQRTPVYPEMAYVEPGIISRSKKKFQEESSTGLKELLNKRPGLIFRKPVAQNADIFSENKEILKRENIISTTTKLSDNSIRDSSKERPTHEINLIADKVYKIIEKKIAIEKDRRGLL